MYTKFGDGGFFSRSMKLNIWSDINLEVNRVVILLMFWPLVVERRCHGNTLAAWHKPCFLNPSLSGACSQWNAV